MKRSVLIIAAIPLLLLLLVVFTIILTPTEAVRGVVVRGLEKEGYSFRAVKFRKAFPLGFAARSVEISSEQGPVVKADTAVVRLKLLPLLIGRVSIAADARIGGGTFAADCTLSGGGSIQLSASHIRLEDIPFFPTVTGGQAKGELRMNAAIKGLRKTQSGEMTLAVRGAELTGLKVGQTPLPDAAYPSVQGKLLFRGGRATLESFTLQGEGLYVRLKGDMPLVAPLSAAPLNVTLELMPKPEFMEKQKFVFLLLTKYLDTPGHYQIPVHGTLSHPAIF